MNPTIRGFLPIPSSHRSVLVEQGLPLAYVDAAWKLIVCTNAPQHEWAFITGAALHRYWERGDLHHFLTASLIPTSDVTIVCPDERLLKARILSYGE